MPVTVLMVSFMLPLVVAELRQLLSDQIAHLSELVESYLADFFQVTGRYMLHVTLLCLQMGMIASDILEMCT